MSVLPKQKSINRLVVQIPCFNEATNLAEVIREIPRQLPGVKEVVVVVVDDGSTDETAEIAVREGADAVISHKRNLGLAAAFSTGLDYALSLGADIVVNTDGDGQYPGGEIERLIGPVLSGEADVVIGDRQPGKLHYFPFIKRLLQVIGSRTVSFLANQKVPDATSGFRAYSREAAMSIHIESNFTYTLETIFQLAQKGFQTTSVKITAKPTHRQSRLMKNANYYIVRSIFNILAFCIIYRPVTVFSVFGLGMFSFSVFLGIRYLWYQLVVRDGLTHLASLILAAICAIASIVIIMFGLFARHVEYLSNIINKMMIEVKTLKLEHKKLRGEGK